MKSVLYSLAFLLMAAVLQAYLPWWIMPLAAAVLSFGFGMKPLPAFGLSFLLAALLWGGYAAYINSLNEGLMAHQIGQLFGGLSGGMMVIVTALFGGLFAGIAGLAGSYSRTL